MALPAVALYQVLSAAGVDAEPLLNAYGDHMGHPFTGIVHGFTRLPGVSRFIWKHIDGIINKMSSEALGYKRKIVSNPPKLYGVHILSCPYHALARKLGCEKSRSVHLPHGQSVYEGLSPHPI